MTSSTSTSSQSQSLRQSQGQSQSQRERTRLDGLPREVLYRITRHLRVRDAYALATVCKALRDAAESIIWRRINTRVSLEWMETLPPFLRYLEDVDVENPPHYDEFTPGFEPAGWEDSHLVRARKASLFSQKLQSRIWRVQDALEARPTRISAVRSLIAMTAVSMIEPVRELIEKLESQVRFISLEEYSDPPASEVASEDDWEHARALFNAMGKVRNLAFLEIYLPMTTWQEGLAGLLASSTTLRRLRLVCEGEENLDSLDPEERDELTHFPEKSSSLRHLEVDQLLDYFPWIDRLIGQAPNLSSLRIYDKNDSWLDRGASEDTFENIAKHPSLQRIDLRGGPSFNDWVNELLREEGFEHVEEVVKRDKIRTVSGFSIQRIDIPPLPSLKRLIMPIITRHWATHPEKAFEKRLSQAFLAQLSETPNLEAIQATQEVSFSPAFENNMLVWCKKAVSGILIRTYLTPDGRDRLTHIRHLELRGNLEGRWYNRSEKVSELDQGPLGLHEIRECFGPECPNHQWTSTTDFNGQPVPDNVLFKVYNTINEDTAFQKPGRNLSLPDEAWEILRRWRGTGPGWEEESGEFLDLAALRASPEYESESVYTSYTFTEEDEYDYPYYSPIDSGSPGDTEWAIADA